MLLALGSCCDATSIEGVSKRYPEIGDRPKKGSSEPSTDSIEPLQRFYLNPAGSIESPIAPEKVQKNPGERVPRSAPQTGFYRTFRIEPLLAGLGGQILYTSPRKYPSRVGDV